MIIPISIIQFLFLSICTHVRGVPKVRSRLTFANETGYIALVTCLLLPDVLSVHCQTL